MISGWCRFTTLSRNLNAKMFLYKVLMTALAHILWIVIGQLIKSSYISSLTPCEHLLLLSAKISCETHRRFAFCHPLMKSADSQPSTCYPKKKHWMLKTFVSEIQFVGSQPLIVLCCSTSTLRSGPPTIRPVRRPHLRMTIGENARCSSLLWSLSYFKTSKKVPYIAEWKFICDFKARVGKNDAEEQHLLFNCTNS